MAANNDIPAFKLNDGTFVPAVGMGCWMGSPGAAGRAEEMCRLSLKHGYRHFDTAAGYRTEEQLGKSIRESGIPRSELYVVTKLSDGMHHAVREAFEASLAKLDVEYIDLYLMHSPKAWIGDQLLAPEESPTYIETWKEMEKLLETGKVKSIGVSNFGLPLLERVIAECTVVPATNQIEMHPCLPEHEMKAFCDKNGIVLTAYSPIGKFADELFKDTALLHLAEKYNVTVAQVILSWGVQRRTIVIPKSESEERMVENITLVAALSAEDMIALDEFHKQPGKHRSLLPDHHDADGKVFGWTYEQLGWKMTTGGFAYY